MVDLASGDMLRTDCIRLLQDFIETKYTGNVTIHREEDDVEIQPPYAVIRIGSAEDIGMSQVDIAEMTVLVGVFHDADCNSIATAETAAAEVFAALSHMEEIQSFMGARGVLVSWWHPLTVEAELAETNWQHVAGFRLVASPSA